MTPEETRQFLDTLAPGELEQLIRESIVSEEDQHEFRKRLALFLESDGAPSQATHFVLAESEPQPEPPTDEELLETFYTACLGEGGTSDEINLRGLRAVLARWGNS